MTVEPIRSGALQTDDVAHGFFTRRGGVSVGLFDSLNCGLGSSDDTDAVVENRRRVTSSLGVSHLVTCHQIHSADVVTVGGPQGRDPWQPAQAPKADAMATNMPGIALGVLTADCAPILLVEPNAKVIAVAHAGWRGALYGVGEAIIEAMENLGAARPDIRATVGPCIAKESYEVGPEFPEPFVDRDSGAKSFFAEGERQSHWQFDLPGYVVARLQAFGVDRANALAHDTYAQDSEFFSYRRSCHKNEPDYGRCISAIALPV